MGRNWAITIGINQYDNLQPLAYARRDAAAMQDYFLHEAGFEEVYYFADDAPDIQTSGPPFKPLPTFAKLDRFLDIRFEQDFLGAGDNFWFFFAGHGKRERGRDYLLPTDVNPRSLERTAISIDHVTERLRRCGADNIILVLDACRNEGDRDGEGIGNETAQLARERGIVTLFSCSPSERSYEIDELQQGAFTYALLQGLRIQGEGNCATVERLCQHLRHQVPAINERYRKPRQTPYPIAEPLSKQHLILLPQFATLADVRALKIDAFEAEAERDWDLAEQLWTRVLAVSPADSQAIKAIKRIARQDLSAVSASPSPTPIPEASGRRDVVEQVRPTLAPSVSTFRFEVITVDAQGREMNRRPGEAEYRVEDLGNGVGLEMVAIPGGKFQMGSPNGEGDDDERPQYPVTVKPFWMGKYAITQAQWKAVAGLSKVERDLEPDPARFKGANRPVEQISWHDATEFCARLSRKTEREYRLPTEAEWEYACRAGTTTPFQFGETITADLVNFRGSFTYSLASKGEYRGQTTDVGVFPPNAFGLFDMHGNVWEWCLDHWDRDFRIAPADGSAWIGDRDPSKRLLRGGSWLNYPRNCRSAFRGRNALDNKNDTIGLRAVSVVSRTS
jgi:formylglycine-generating enzyme required for sulfatase activity/uncharacterized caspase-like protein